MHVLCQIQEDSHWHGALLAIGQLDKVIVHTPSPHNRADYNTGRTLFSRLQSEAEFSIKHSKNIPPGGRFNWKTREY